jgi:Berberine and berberine like
VSRLTNIAARFNELGITIPHGECPLVNIGGHAQTGGYGHFIRGFGLGMDYITGIRIVLADGTIKDLTRPNGAPKTPDEELFWGILGGNAGSFGIVTKYQITCVRDADHPNSYGYAGTRKYDKERYYNLMKIVQQWSTEVTKPTFRGDVDFTMTVESQAFPLPAPAHVIEMVYSNVEGSGEQFDPEQFFSPIMQAADAGPQLWLMDSTTKGPKSCSALADSFVRRFPTTTLDGREFKYPYRKRINCTMRELSDRFIDDFVNMVDKVVMQTEGVYLVFQMAFGGGAFRNSPRRTETSIPRRDFVFFCVFDLFHEEDRLAEAENLQDEMQKIIDASFSPGDEGRLFWGSFGDIDMSQQKVVNYYYDDASVYRKLQDLKKRVDPTNLFHSKFSVTLPR